LQVLFVHLAQVENLIHPLAQPIKLWRQAHLL